MKISPAARTTAALASAALLLTACGGGGSDAGTNTTSTASSGADGQLTEMNVSLLPIVDVLPVQLAIQEGIFTKHGLKVNTTPAQSSAGLVPSILEGSVDVAFGSAVTLFIGYDKGLPLDVVFLGGATERPKGTPGGDHTASVFMVNEDSPLQRPKDLGGKTVSVNAIGGIQEVAVKNAIEKDGGDPSAVQLLELPLSQAQGALDADRVDAASVNEPFTTTMLNAGKRSIGDTVKEIDGTNINLELYFTSEKYAKANPEALDNFRAALDEAIDIINNDYDKAKAALQKYTEIDPAIIDQIPIHHFEKTVTKSALTDWINATQRYGLISDKVTPDSIMAKVPTLQD